MGERRQSRRYGVSLPLQVCISKRPVETYNAQVRDISRSGIYFQSRVPIEPGSLLELAFSLPTEAASVMVRASAKALRTSRIEGSSLPLYGIAATIDRIDFVSPVVSNAA
ncbi:MAG TPA: PilZ domain-containing protein [Candidatus Acidoferrales bacterium]|nr:PilZ domain-containing protein [Candidatus Acidoferrales bacterium]